MAKPKTIYAEVPMVIHITAQTIENAVPSDPGRCVIACAVKESLGLDPGENVIVSAKPGKTRIVMPNRDTVVFATPSNLGKFIPKYDAGTGSFPTGKFKLAVVPKSNRPPAMKRRSAAHRRKVASGLALPGKSGNKVGRNSRKVYESSAREKASKARSQELLSRLGQ